MALSSDLTVQPEHAAGPPLIGALLRMPADAVLGRLLAGLHEDGFTDLNSAHLPLLRYPGPESRRPSELATEARMTRQAMNYLLGELERLGYLIRRDDPDDRRSKRVHLTERGRAVVRTIRRTVRRIEAGVGAGAGPVAVRPAPRTPDRPQRDQHRPRAPRTAAGHVLAIARAARSTPRTTSLKQRRPPLQS